MAIWRRASEDPRVGGDGQTEEPAVPSSDGESPDPVATTPEPAGQAPSVAHVHVIEESEDFPEAHDGDLEQPLDEVGDETIEPEPQSDEADDEQGDPDEDSPGEDLDDESSDDAVEASEVVEEPASTRPVRALPRIIAVANQKGGVGKTTTTVNLGAGLAELGYRVLVIDLDPQGNATTGLGIERKNFEHSMYDVIMREHPLEDCIEPTSVKNLFVAPATLDLSGVEIELVPAFSRELRLKRAIEVVIDEFDFIMIDCPPSLGLITINALAAAGEVLVPIQCEYYALEGLSQLRSTLKLVSGNLNESLELSTIVLTMFDSRTRLSTDVANDVREHFPDQVCDTVIPRTVRLSEAPSFGQPITVFDSSSRGAQAYRSLAKEVSNGAPKRTG